MYTFTTIKNLHADLLAGKTTCVQLVEESINAIESKKQLNAFLEVFSVSALAQAKLVDEKLGSATSTGSVSSDKKLGRLAGVIIGLKDNICYKGHKVSCSSKILEGFESLYSSTVVERLLAEGGRFSAAARSMWNHSSCWKRDRARGNRTRKLSRARGTSSASTAAMPGI